jgi:type II secretory pathway component PulK
MKMRNDGNCGLRGDCRLRIADCRLDELPQESQNLRPYSIPHSPFRIPHSSLNPQSRRGVVLIIVLIVVVVLALAAYTFTELMITHREATEYSGRQAQSRLLVDSGVDSVRRFLMQDKITQFEAGGIYDNPLAFQGQLVLDDPDPNLRGRFTVMAPLLDDEGYPGGLRYGLENESARVNINALLWLESQPGMQGAGRALLMALPNMTEDIADAIMDYIDEDTEPREFGAEDEYYFELDPPYLAKNAPLDTVEELLLVRGVTPQLLFGADANRNGVLDSGEALAATETEATTGAAALLESEFGSMDRGWSAYLTLWSMERNANALGEPRIFINQDDMQALHEQLTAYMDESWANFIVAYRQYGPAGGNNGGNNQGGNNGGNNSGDSGAVSNPASEIPLDLTQPGQHKITQIIELIGAKIAIPTGGGNGGGGNNGGGQNGGNNGGGGNNQGGNNNGGGNNQGGNNQGGNNQGGNNQGGNNNGGGNPAGNNQGGQQGNQQDAVVYDSPFSDDILAMAGYLPTLLDSVSVNRSAWVPGRININQAPWSILANIPGMSPEIADQIIANREMSDAAEESDPNRRFETWILTSGIVTLQEMRTLTPFITAGGDVYRAQIVGYFEDGAASSRAEVVIDATQSTPRILFWRDISHLGRGHALETLGVEASSTPY